MFLYTNRDYYYSNLYENVISILFYFFFTCIALNPGFGTASNQFTLYLYWIIPLFNINFLYYEMNNIRRIKISKSALFGVTVLLSFFLFLGRFSLIIKILGLLIALSYLFYCRDRNQFKYFYLFLNINIIVGIIQFLGYYLIGQSFSMSIGPTAVSKLLWGPFSTQTYSNFFVAVGSFVRVSGWSREAGFFAALILMALLIYLFDYSKKLSFSQLFLFAVGFFISFSKVSLALFFILVIIFLHKFIDSVPYWFTVFFYMIASILIAIYLDLSGTISFTNISIAQRLCSILVIKDFNFTQLMIGINSLLDISSPSFLTYLLIGSNLTLTGIASVIAQVGVPGLLIFFALVKSFRITSSGILIILIVTISTDPFTSTSFVILSYIYAYLISNDNKSAHQYKGTLDECAVN